MVAKKSSKNGWVKKFFGCLFSAIVLISGMMSIGVMSAMAEPVDGVITEENAEVLDKTDESTENKDESTKEGEKEHDTGEENKNGEEPKTTCADALGALGWLVCPSTGKIAEAVDWLYDKIENILEINPVEMKDGSPMYEVWKYFRGVTNIVFIIFLLIVVYSQVTGVGITNYGIKKVLPKLIVAAVLVNLSFLLCSLAVDVSNIVGHSLRGLFETIETSTMASMEMGANGAVTATEMYSAINGGAAIAVGAGLIAFETGAIWMLIPTVLGAIVAVVVGLITIAMRQAVVALLIMIAPLAVVAYMLPNTDQWFKKWRGLLTKMLVFYPMFSLLFGASELAGWAIIVSAHDGFGVMLGVAVQIFPLFFSWHLMKMSGTFLSMVHTKLSGLAARPLAANRAWAESHRQLSKQKHLASGNVYSPSLKLQQYLSDRKIAREEATRGHAETVRNKGLAYSVNRNYRKDKKTLSHEGEGAFEEMTRNITYQREMLKHKNTFNQGVGGLGRDLTQTARLKALDANIIRESDKLKMEQARGELIDYRNAVGFHERMEAAIDVHMDEKNGYQLNSEAGERIARSNYKFHLEDNPDLAKAAQARYKDLSDIMGGNEYDVQYAAAVAAHARDSQQKIHDNRLQKYAELVPPTRDVEYRLKELIDAADKSGNNQAIKNVDAIISFMRVLNQRGDTDLVSDGIYRVLEHGLELGTHASQAIAGFAMFEVNNSDPFLKRFGKYVNLETAQVFNKNKRQNRVVTLDEFVTGQYEEIDQETGQTVIKYSKRPMAILMEGTSLDGIERTALDDGDAIMRHAYLNEDGKLDAEGIRKFFNKRGQIDTAMEPQFISACLKYVSGSEQLKSAVRYKTGYSAEMMVGEDGQVYTDDNGDPLYEWKAIWEKDELNNPYYDDVDYAKEYFRSRTIKYLTGQTPIQILNLRSDFYDGLREHLASTFMMNKDEDLDAEQLQAKQEFEAEKERIEAKYGKEPKGTQKLMMDKEMRAATHKIAGLQLRKMLDETGTLEQIYRSRTSGAANSAKPWVRDWLGLDNEVAIRDYEDKKRTERKLERAERKAKIKQMEEEMRKKKKGQPESDKGDEPSDMPQDLPPVYDSSDREEFQDYIIELYKDMRDDDEGFYENALAYLIESLSAESYVVQELKRRCKDYPGVTAHDMKEWILELLNDLNNY